MSDSGERVRPRGPARAGRQPGGAEMLRPVGPSSPPAVSVVGHGLGIDALVQVARSGGPVVLAPEAATALDSAHRSLAARVRAGRPVYGWNTGVGAFDGRRVTARDNREHQKRLLRSHAAGVGAPMTVDQVRAMILARANMLVAARSGVRLPTMRGIGTEDHVSMSALAARHAAWSVRTAETVVAIELLCAARAVQLAGRPLPPPLRHAYREVAAAIGDAAETRALGDEIEAVRALLAAGALER